MKAFKIILATFIFSVSAYTVNSIYKHYDKENKKETVQKEKRKIFLDSLNIEYDKNNLKFDEYKNKALMHLRKAHFKSFGKYSDSMTIVFNKNEIILNQIKTARL
jgi:hypothetical protein